MSDPAQNRLDPAALARLLRIGGATLAREMINLLLDYAPQRLSQALAAQRVGDLVGIAKAVHPLRSGGAHVGAFHLQDLAGRIEILAKQEAAAQIPPLLSELEVAWAQTKVQLEKERESLNA